MDVLQWAIGILIVIQMAIMGFFGSALWAHVVECRQLSGRLEGIAKDVERMKEDIGTHDTGMRGNLHNTGTLCAKFESRLSELERDSRKP